VMIGWKMPQISMIENLCSQKKWAKVHQKILGDATPKTSHHAKFHRDRSNQLGDRGWSEKNFHTQTWHTDICDTQTHGILTGWVAPCKHARWATKDLDFTDTMPVQHMLCLSVYLSVHLFTCLSIRNRSSAKTTKHGIKQRRQRN